MLYKLFLELREYFSPFNVFRYITFRTLVAILFAMLVVFIFTPGLIEKLRRLKIGDRARVEYLPEHDKKQGTPTMGGILIILAIIITSLLFNNLSNSYVWYVLLVTFSFSLIGFIDDLLKLKNKDGLKGSVKFIFESFIAISVALMLSRDPSFSTKLVIPFFKQLSPDLGPYYLFLIWFVIVGTANAVNLTDGLDGLAIGPVLTTAGTYMIFSYVMGHEVIAGYLGFPFVYKAGELAIIAGAVIGAGIAFLWYNTYPAQVFMGDVGSLGLGGLLGTMAILSKQEILLGVVGGIFVIEALSVIIQVGYFKITGKRIFLMAPIHHHFEKKGWDEPKVTVRFWIISIILALIALSSLKLR